MNHEQASDRRRSSSSIPSSITQGAIVEIGKAMTTLLSDMYGLYFKTKNFEWHMSGPHFREYHALLRQQSGEIVALADGVAARVRKIGGVTLRSLGQAARSNRLIDNDADHVSPMDMLTELQGDNLVLIAHMRSVHALCQEHGDVASVGMLMSWIDQAEERVWILFESRRH